MTTNVQTDARQAEVLATIISLTEGERLDAKAQARTNAIRAVGSRPDRADFQDRHIDEYPRYVVRTVALFLGIALVGAALVSVFRVFSAGRDEFIRTMPGEPAQGAISGLAAFLLAEFLVLAATLARDVFFSGRGKHLMLVPMLLGTAMALVGNLTIGQPVTTWGYLETFAPPIAVLFGALIFERVILSGIKRRTANERDYQAALKEWDRATAEPEKLPGWRQHYAQALKETLIAVNGQGRGQQARREFMAGMHGPEWSIVVWREMQAEHWFDETTATAADARPTQAAQAAPLPELQPVQTMRPAPTAIPTPAGNGNGNGSHR